LCYKLVHYRVNKCVHNKITLKSAKNHTNWFIRFEDIIVAAPAKQQSNIVASFFWTTLYTDDIYGKVMTSKRPNTNTPN